ncbi:nucleoside phosphorylase [Ornithinibacillus gellani]|uniref:nucleoside phosphorylase n=1 Tax=Ornithinibacillus gellani TaxID=2293253 RepID=UPI000F47435F|nr:nucleoside phosphorylase [Ornithinibacillus gellani]TQS75923.1 nucleoside phosphorylase [Ornithinibacillus gellani]
MENVHLKTIQPSDLGEVTLLVGDPGRVELISQNWEDTRLLLENREFILVSGKWKGKIVSICSTGIGLGSTEIAVIELIQSGAKKLIRLGGCGTFETNMRTGDIMLNHAMARDKGILANYVDDNYPAVADFDLLQTIKTQIKHAGFQVHSGIGMTTQSYYLGQGRAHEIENGPKPDPSMLNYWKDRHITNYEMETAILYLLASLYQIPAANCLVIHVNRSNDEWVPDEAYQKLHQKAAQAILDACTA